ncbi:MAG: hypothetical protein WA901_17225, partial [Phormidesmis sp.]
QSATRHIAQLMHAPLVGLVTWENGADIAQIGSVTAQSNQFQLDGQQPILIEADALINWAIATEGLLIVTLEDLPTDSPRWISGPAGSQVLAMALRTAPEHEPNAIVVIADSASRQWSDEQTTLLAIVVNQLAWCRRHLKLTQKMLTQQQQLTQLNWYKQHQIEDLSRSLNDCLSQLNLRAETSNPRQQHLMAQLNEVVKRLEQVSHQERWAIAL